MAAANRRTSSLPRFAAVPPRRHFEIHCSNRCKAFPALALADVPDAINEKASYRYSPCSTTRTGRLAGSVSNLLMSGAAIGQGAGSRAVKHSRESRDLISIDPLLDHVASGMSRPDHSKITRRPCRRFFPGTRHSAMRIQPCNRQGEIPDDISRFNACRLRSGNACAHRQAAGPRKGDQPFLRL